MKKRILYIMNVDWNWIKQRPHYIAEELMQFYDVYVVYQYRYTRNGYQNRDVNNNIIAMKVIPRIDRYNSLRWINLALKKHIISKLIRQIRPDYIYVTFPEQIEWIPQRTDAQIIYDCMDDHYGLATNGNLKKIILKDEKILCKRSKRIFISSLALKDILSNRYRINIHNKVTLVRNGYNGKIAFQKLYNNSKNDLFTICYFGTIAEWFDFDLITRSLRDFTNIRYKLIGPVLRNIQIPNNPRIQYVGTVEHDELLEVTDDADCFIMPFQLNESIRAVDPVKLYEYINLNKNIICVRYQEVERFEHYAYLYNDYEEFKKCLNNILQNNALKYTNEERIEFLHKNSWEERSKTIAESLGDS